MNPANTTRVLRRIAAIIENADAPSRDSVRRDVAHLKQALAGSESSYRYLVSRFLRKSSDHDLLKQIDQAFLAKDVYPPFLKKVSAGYYCGDIGGGIELEIGIEGGKIDKVAVAGRLARDLSEAPDMFKFFRAKLAQGGDGGLPQITSQGQGQQSDQDGDPNTFKCDNCGKDVEVDKSYDPCPNCGTTHTQCPGCEGWYDMEKNTDDHCPLCGYSSWGDDESPEPLNAIGVGEVVEVPASKPGATYKLQHVQNPQTGADVYSCSCPAWKIQKLPPEQRTCKHLKAYLGEEFEDHRIENA